MKIKLLFCFALIMSIKATLAQTVPIPDYNFEHALIQLGLDDNGYNGNIEQSVAENLITLDLDGRGISNLQGIEYFINLKSLSCNNNQLTSLDVSNISGLQNLNFSHNQITSVNISNNPELITIVGSNNQLTNIDLSNKPLLETLTINSNNLSSLDVTSNHHLRNLRCALNNLDFLDLTFNINLIDVYCNNNQLTDLYLYHNTLLENLHIYSNQLSSIDISDALQLKSIEAQNNILTSLDVSNNIALERLLLALNQITSLDVSANPVLNKLQISNNNLTDLNVKNGNNSNFIDFSANNNDNLECIEVDNASWSTQNWSNGIDTDTTAFSEDCSLPFPTIDIPDSNFEQALIDLNIDTNGLNGNILKYQAEQIISLAVNDKGINSLEGIEGFTNLIHLFCAQNNFSSIDLSNNTALETLLCINSGLTSLNLDSNLALKNLNCSGNALTSLDLSNNAALLEVNVSINDLTSLDVKNGTNSIITTFNTTQNPNLTCIDVDSAIYSNANWTIIDPQTSFSQDCDANIQIPIPDVNFEMALIAANIDNTSTWASPDGYITKAEAEAVTTMDVSNKNINNLEGIEAFVNLTYLNVNSNNISSLDVSSNTLLRELHSEYNNLTTIDLSTNSFLEILKCEGNQLTSFDLTSNTALIELNCSYSQLTSLDVTQNILLTNLSCYHNQITSLDLSNNGNLHSISVNNNQLISLNLKNGDNTSIDTLFLNNNPNLFCVEVENVTYSNDNWIDVNWAEIDTQTSFATNCSATIAIPDANFEQELITQGIDTNGLNGNILQYEAEAVTSLSIDNDIITNFGGIEGFTNLSNLHIKGDSFLSLNITSNTALEYFSVDMAYSLQSLDISTNVALKVVSIKGAPLETLDVTNKVDLEELIIEISNIEEIDLSNNTQLTKFESWHNNLISLDLSNNSLLTYLLCIGNQLQSLNVKNGNNDNITYFNATDNSNLLCIEVDDAAYSTTNWTNIDAQTNFNENCADLVFIPGANFEQALIDEGVDTWGILNGYITKAEAEAVTSLDLNSKNISNLEGIQSFINLTALSCADNQLQTIDLSQNTALVELSCAYNQLTTIDLSNNIDLEFAILNNNNLTTIDVSNNINLIQLYVDYNQLPTIDVSTNDLLEALSCSNNQLTDIDLNNNLKGIICNNNLLTSIDIPSGLTGIDCAFNQITHLDFSNNPNLHSFIANDNQLEILNLKNGNNVALHADFFNITNNPNLYCVLVDDVNYSDTNWTFESNSIDAQTSFSETVCNVELAARVFLQGAAINPNAGEETLMRDDLRVQGLIPTVSPYGDDLACWNSVFDVTGPNAIVDWVQVSLHKEEEEGNSIRLYDRRSALLQRDGDIVDVDGVSPITFSDAWAGQYMVKVYHRNHLGVMTNGEIITSHEATTLDFTNANNSISYGAHAQTTLGLPSGKLGLWAGNAFDDNFIQYSGNDPDSPELLSAVLNHSGNSIFGFPTFSFAEYHQLDLDMNGHVQYTGSNPDTTLILQNVLWHPSNFLNLNTFKIIEQSLSVLP